MEENNYNILDLPEQGLGLRYAGFWERFVAFIIDSLLLSVVSNIFTYTLFQTTSLTQPKLVLDPEENPLDQLLTFYAGLLPMMILGILINWLYFAFMESSANQATLGKMVLLQSGNKPCMISWQGLWW
jgi:uncharacterized RDD family membrane protein YckC